jgi:hypothetical protein
VVLGGAERVLHSGRWSGEDTKHVTTRVYSSQGETGDEKKGVKRGGAQEGLVS